MKNVGRRHDAACEFDHGLGEKNEPLGVVVVVASVRSVESAAVEILVAPHKKHLCAVRCLAFKNLRIHPLRSDLHGNFHARVFFLQRRVFAHAPVIRNRHAHLVPAFLQRARKRRKHVAQSAGSREWSQFAAGHQNLHAMPNVNIEAGWHKVILKHNGKGCGTDVLPARNGRCARAVRKFPRLKRRSALTFHFEIATFPYLLQL